MDQLNWLSTNMRLGEKYLEEIKAEFNRQKAKIDSLQKELSERPALIRPAVSCLPSPEAVFTYDGAVRRCRLLGMLNEHTLKCFDLGAKRVKNYSIAKIENLVLRPPTTEVELAYNYTPWM